ncbi:MAG: LysE family translocator [Brachymonas sp.]|nr:LysE family translocator [Brachymonas sp.]
MPLPTPVAHAPLSAAVLLPILLYAVVTSVTPGPNNMMLLSSGLRFGVRRTVPHILGIVIGGTFMVVLTGLGIASVLERYPLVQAVLKWGGLVYLLWLAWQMTRMAAPAPQTDAAHAADQAASSSTPTARPLGFWGAAAFQWINPKLWMMALGLFSSYLPAHSGTTAVVVASLIFGIANLPCVSVWAVAGHSLRA